MVFSVNKIGFIMFFGSAISGIFILTPILIGDPNSHESFAMGISGLLAVASDLTYRLKHNIEDTLKDRLIAFSRGGVFGVQVWIVGALLLLGSILGSI